MSDFVTQMFYDQGHFDAVENDKPLFSKPIWKHLIHETKSADDRTRILSAKAFNAATNPNIIAGIYTRPDVWVDDDMPADDRLIKFCTRNCNFAHNGANRPMDALNGVASVWWNELWCDAAAELGVNVRPTMRADDHDWLKANRKLVDFVIKEKRHPFINAVNHRIAELNIDILGQGGEFIITNQAVVDWDRTRTDSGFQTAHRRRFDAIKERMEAAYHDLRDLIMELRKGGDQIAMFTTKAIPTLNCLVMKDIMMKEDMVGHMLTKAQEIATKHGLKLGLDADPFEMGNKTPADYGFMHKKGSYWFQ